MSRRGAGPSDSRGRLTAVALLLLCALRAAPLAAQQGPDVAAFDRFIQSNAPLCLLQPARICFEAGWAMADSDADARLSASELERVRAELTEWARWKKQDLHQQDWTGIQLGLLVVRMVGLERLVASLDQDGDQQLTRNELLADVTLDQRPLPQVLLDRGSVDWEAVSRRLGAFAGLLEGIQAGQ